MIFGINTTSDISKLLNVISRAVRRVKFETTLNYHDYYKIFQSGACYSSSAPPLSPSQTTMMVDIQPQQQQDANANAAVPGYEVQTITMEMGPDSATATEDRDMRYSGEDLFLEEKKVSFVED